MNDMFIILKREIEKVNEDSSSDLREHASNFQGEMLHLHQPLTWMAERPGIQCSGLECFLLASRPDGKPGRDSGTLTPRKEVIHPHLPVGIPCYDLKLVIDLAVTESLACALGSSASGIANSTHLTGSVYKERERIHRSHLICDYYQFRLHEGEFQPSI